LSVFHFATAIKISFFSALSHRGVGLRPYGLRLVERVYSSERPEAEICAVNKKGPDLTAVLRKSKYN
jgi:hypothetical protein